ncbi:hypothetical protein [Thiolapillus sp.]
MKNLDPGKASVYLVKDAGLEGKNIRIMEQLDIADLMRPVVYAGKTPLPIYSAPS